MGTAPDPFAGMVGVKSETLSSDERLRAAIVGAPKSGKSWFAATAPPPVLHFDFDNRWAALEGKPGLLVVKNASMLDVESNLSMLKLKKAKGEPMPVSFVFDTVTWMEKAIEKLGFEANKDFYASYKFGSQTIKVRKGWDAINTIKGYMNYIIEEFGAFGNIIFVFHEKDEKDYDKSTTKEAAWTGKQTVNPQYLAPCLSLLNENFRIQYDAGLRKYVVSCRPTSDFNASTTLLVDDIEPPNLVEMLAKHRQKRAALQAASTTK